MKSINSIIKNLKLLMRSKSSALVVLFAPLLIVLIIGFSFAEFEQSSLNIGYHVSEHTDLTQRFLTNLNNSGNNLIEYNSPESCVRSIQEGVILACIGFPAGFSVGNTRQELTFYVDESRLNLVYQLVSSLSTSASSEQTEISQEITTSLLDLIDKSATGFSTTISDIVSLKARVSSINTNVNRASSDVSSLEIETTNLNPTTLKNRASGLEADYQELIDLGEDLVSSGNAFYTATEGSPSAQRTAFKSDLDALDSVVSSNTSMEDFKEFVEVLDNFISAFNSLKSQIASVSNVQKDVQSSLNTVSSTVNSLNSDLDQIKVKQETLLEQINRLEFRSAEAIAQPFTTKIEPVTASLGRLTYSFPYLLMLVIMFIGIMLSSTLVFMEKDSKAFFRNFTTPTKQIFFTTMTYITSMIIILLQVFVILFVAYFFLEISMFTNWEVSLLIIILGSTLFILLGMVIGNMFSTSEAITMSNIFLGAVFMFLSNLILPLETLSVVIQKVASYNPFVIAGEAMRGALLFELDTLTLLPSIIMMISISLFLFLFILLFQNVSGSAYIYKLKNRNKKIILPEDHYLTLEDKNITIKNLADLAGTLELLTEEEYLRYTKPKNLFSEWLEKSLKERFLAYRIKKKAKAKALKILQKQLKKKKNKNL
jgi:ABC-2 type transport system permease protein